MTRFPPFTTLAGTVLAGILALAVSANPAMAKKGAPDMSETGGLFQPPSPIVRPSLVMDTLIPKAEAHPAAEPEAPPVHIIRPVAVSIPAKPADIPRTVESLRIYGLFE